MAVNMPYPAIFQAKTRKNGIDFFLKKVTMGRMAQESPSSNMKSKNNLPS